MLVFATAARVSFTVCLGFGLGNCGGARLSFGLNCYMCFKTHEVLDLPVEVMMFRSMFFQFCLVMILVQVAGAQTPPVLFEKPLSPRIANYNIAVKLNTETRELDGNEVLVWHNKTRRPVKELQFHLYLNAFRNTKSTFMKESGGSHRGNKIAKDGWGFSEVQSLKVHYGKDLENTLQYLRPADAPKVLETALDLTGEMEFIQPDDGNPYDKTVFRVPLPRAVRPGEFVSVKIDFKAKLPSPPFARTGAKKEFFFVGQWFPKIGVFTDNGWNTHQFHRNSEFFADFGVYNVQMTVPSENIVGATGLQYALKENDDGTATHFYHAEDVHDFAWTTSPDYVEFTGKAQDVNIRVLMQPDHKNQGERYLRAAIKSVSAFQDRYGDYPFPNLTVVDPRRGAMGAGGMEYPTLITAGTVYGIPEGLRMPEMVILHEFGHNYWYHLLASNEFEESWMDEGINSYTEVQIMHDLFGPEGDAIDVLGVKVNDLQFQRMQYISFPDADPVVRKAWEFYSNGSYGVNSYSKPAMLLTTLQNYLGEDLMLKVMREYVKRWRFKHPTTRDFIAVVNDVTGQDLNWYFDQALYSRAVLDYSVSNVFTRKVKPDKGFDFDQSISEDSTTATDEMSSGPDSLAADGKTDSASGEAKSKILYFSGVDVRRLGEFKFPVEVEVVFQNGEVIREQWDGQGLWKKFRYTKPARLVSATVDPDFKIPLDVNVTNNSRTVKKQRLGLNKISARLMFWMQFLLDDPEFISLLSVPMNDLF